MVITVLVHSARRAPIMGVVLLTHYKILQGSDSELLRRLDFHQTQNGFLVLRTSMEVGDVIGRELRLQALDDWWLGYKVADHVAGEE